MGERTCPRRHKDKHRAPAAFWGELGTLGTRGFGKCLTSKELAGRGSKQHSQTLGKHIQEQEGLELPQRVLVGIADDGAAEAQAEDGVCGCAEHHEPLRHSSSHPGTAPVSAEEAAPPPWAPGMDCHCLGTTDHVERPSQAASPLELVSNPGSRDWPEPTPGPRCFSNTLVGR